MNSSKGKTDIFDRIMRFPSFHRRESLYRKHKEILLYLFFGGLSFLVSIGSFSFFVFFVKTGEVLGNIWSWVCAVLFAYITNRLWVFEDKARTKKKVLREVSLFFSGRVFTLLVEEAIIYIFVTILCYHAVLIKTAAQIVVIIMNYIISKVVVFKHRA